jgi:hypothetical protein
VSEVRFNGIRKMSEEEQEDIGEEGQGLVIKCGPGLLT